MRTLAVPAAVFLLACLSLLASKMIVLYWPNDPPQAQIAPADR
jgi:hypothetical protein